MSFNQLSYDPATYERDLKESTAQGKYQMYSGFGQQTNGTCTMSASYQQAHDQNSISSIVDQESELLNLTRPLTKNPMEEYPFKQSNVNFHSTLPDCGPDNEIQHSRYTPFTERRDINIIRNNNEGLCQDPQSLNRIPSNTRSGMNTRLLYRDNYSSDQSEVNYQNDNDAFAPNESQSRQPLDAVPECDSCKF
jgi:hypothetical protein